VNLGIPRARQRHAPPPPAPRPTVYPIGIPALYAALFRKHRHTLNQIRALEIKRGSLVTDSHADDELDRWDKVGKAPKQRRATHRDEAKDTLEGLEAREAALKATLPSYILTLTAQSGYSARVYYFEIVECARKLLIVCVPVIFESGTTAQVTTPQPRAPHHQSAQGGQKCLVPVPCALSLIASRLTILRLLRVRQRLFGLMICFLTFGAYTMIKPYADDNDQTFAVLAQVCIFFSLLSSVALDTANPTGAVAKTMDVLLMLLFSLPVALEVRSARDPTSPRPSLTSPAPFTA